MTNPEVRLRAFQAENNIYTKGPLSLVIQFTRLVRKRTFPLNPDDFQTSSKGQVAGLGGGNLKKILKEHGITQQLSAEGGRTSRGSMGLMIKYVDLLNEWNTEETVDFAVVEDFGQNKFENISGINLLFLRQIRQKQLAQIWMSFLNKRGNAKGKILERNIWGRFCSILSLPNFA